MFCTKFAKESYHKKLTLMKKLLIISCMLVLTLGLKAANENPYKINQTQVETMFSQADEIGITLTSIADLNQPFTLAPERSRKNAWVAWALTYTASVGLCGFHRLYLGTETLTFIAYLCTGGGCGIVQTVDWVVLLIGAINDDIRKYEDNSKFFMW